VTIGAERRAHEAFAGRAAGARQVGQHRPWDDLQYVFTPDDLWLSCLAAAGGHRTSTSERRASGLHVRQRAIPHTSRSRSPEAPARTRQYPQRHRRKALLAPGIHAYPRSGRTRQDRPVTPEVAGSSPVAPVSRSACKEALFVVREDAKCSDLGQHSGSSGRVRIACPTVRNPCKSPYCVG
jgi:hypothetical protein